VIPPGRVHTALRRLAGRRLGEDRQRLLLVRWLLLHVRVLLERVAAVLLAALHARASGRRR
jgi:hypothetical protein